MADSTTELGRVILIELGKREIGKINSSDKIII